MIRSSGQGMPVEHKSRWETVVEEVSTHLVSALTALITALEAMVEHLDALSAVWQQIAAGAKRGTIQARNLPPPVAKPRELVMVSPTTGTVPDPMLTPYVRLTLVAVANAGLAGPTRAVLEVVLPKALRLRKSHAARTIQRYQRTKVTKRKQERAASQIQRHQRGHKGRILAKQTAAAKQTWTGGLFNMLADAFNPMRAHAGADATERSSVRV